MLYLVPNLADAAVARRIHMMRAGGAEVAIAGFRRADAAPPDLDVVNYVELGETFDARFGQRITAVVRALGSIVRRLRPVGMPDVVIARNLEMLPLAQRLRASWPARPPLVYECLDIHRLLLREDVIGRAMRGTEQHLTRNAALLLTSSPAFLRNYFDIHGAPPAVVVENKVFFEAGAPRGSNPALTSEPATDGPIRIGWFGALRCRKSLDALARFANAMDGKVEIVLRGRPALTEFPDFHGFVATQPHMRFEGPYRNPQDLADIYSTVHLAWAIDFFEEGLNSQWLLPNRIYEGCLHGAVPVALAGTETAALVERHGIGIVLPNISETTLFDRLGTLTTVRIGGLARAVAAVDEGHFACNAAECRMFVDRLQALTAPDQTLREAA
ncbi:glycosyl transferase family 1 [Devosia nitrariae]|uniref:glycosyl transferase family 1 n=1 Tax=Devosia nitrariae TaxID=2071872 RepID=UPI0032AF2097